MKSDLEQFDIPYDFNYLKSKSKDTFKKVVKAKAKEFAYEELLAKQKQHTKMENVNYSELKRQTYFNKQSLRIEDMRNVFRFRVRMARFGHNYRGNRENIDCPLCASHLDKQCLSLHCREITSRIKIECNMDEIYSTNVPTQAARTITEIMKLRERLMKTEYG